MFYKIYCKDPEVKEIYVGRSSNINSREELHKKSCEGSANIKVYNYINKNGGWSNWIMEIIDYKKLTTEDARKTEEEYRVNLNATLNSYKCNSLRGDEKDKIQSNTLFSILTDCGVDIYSNEFCIKNGMSKENADKYKYNTGISHNRNDRIYDLTKLRDLNNAIKYLLKHLKFDNSVVCWERHQPIMYGKQVSVYKYCVNQEQRDMWDILIENYEMGH